MKSVLFVIAALLGYSFANVWIEEELDKKVDQSSVLICYGVIVFAYGLLTRQLTYNSNDPSFIFPTGKMLKWVAFVGIAYALSDYFYFGSYNAKGGSLLTTTSIISLVPLCASLITYLFYGKNIPSVPQIIGCVVGLIALAIFLYGDTIVAKFAVK